MQKVITIVCYGYRIKAKGWAPEFDQNGFETFIEELKSEYEKLGISVDYL